MNLEINPSVNQHIPLPNQSDIKLYIKREDQIHPFVSGNKYRKLKYNLIEAKLLNYDTVLTFGGAYSNHIAAVAYAAFVNGFKSIGVIRGEELASKINENPTLKFAKTHGMKFKFVSRETYREKHTLHYQESLISEFDRCYVIPEGGTNTLAVRGCKEILNRDDVFDYICCSVGTGGTISGLINSSKKNQKILGFPALKGTFLKDNISKFVISKQWELITDYHFGGYAKITEELITFLNDFYQNYQIPLDPVYTGKMMYGILDMIECNMFPKETRILAIHTGGLQGIEGMNQKLKQKRLPLIDYKSKINE